MICAMLKTARSVGPFYVLLTFSLFSTIAIRELRHLPGRSAPPPALFCLSAQKKVEYRSITEPIRKVNAEANYLEATCTGIDVDRKTITCENVVCEGTTCNIEVSPACGTGLVGRTGCGEGD